MRDQKKEDREDHNKTIGKKFMGQKSQGETKETKNNCKEWFASSYWETLAWR